MKDLEDSIREILESYDTDLTVMEATAAILSLVKGETTKARIDELEKFGYWLGQFIAICSALFFNVVAVAMWEFKPATQSNRGERD